MKRTLKFPVSVLLGRFGPAKTAKSNEETCRAWKAWRDSRPASAISRKKDVAANTAQYMAAGPMDRDEMYQDADDNLSFRQRTANTSYIVGGLLAGVDAGLLSQLFHNVPTYVVASWVFSLIALVTGVFPAVSELFRQHPTERKVTKERHTEQPEQDGIKATKWRAARYAQMRQRTYHLQRNVYRFRWAMSVGLIILVQSLPVMIWTN